MPKLLLKCESCGSYTFNTIDADEDSEIKHCTHCGGKLKTPHPPKFSIDNKYSNYLRKMKKESQ